MSIVSAQPAAAAPARDARHPAPAAPTIFDVARQAGVSKSTVSKVLTGSPHVNSATRQRVLEAIRQLNYHPNVAARRFKSRVSHLIGFISPNIGEPTTSPAFFTAFMIGAGRVAGPRQYDIVWLVSVSSHAPQPDDYAKIFLRREVDGLLVTNTPSHDPRVEALKATGCPFVIVGRYDDPEVCTVDVDNVAVGYLATSHLLERGHRRIGLLNGQPDLPFCRDRFQGYAQALRERSLGLNEALVTWQRFTAAEGQAAMERLLALPEPPTAIIVTDPALRAGCLRALGARRLRLPDDLALVAVEDFEPQGETISFTSVVQPTVDLAACATERLLALIAGERPAEMHCLLPPRLIAGQSTTS